MSNSLKIFKEKANEIMKVFEHDKKAKDNRLNKFEESNIKFFKCLNQVNEALEKLQKKLNFLNLEIEKIKAEKNKKVQEISKKYEESLQVHPFNSHFL